MKKQRARDKRHPPPTVWRNRAEDLANSCGRVGQLVRTTSPKRRRRLAGSGGPDGKTIRIAPCERRFSDRICFLDMIDRIDRIFTILIILSILSEKKAGRADLRVGRDGARPSPAKSG